MSQKESFKYPNFKKKTSKSDIVPENLEGISDVFKFGDQFLEVPSTARGKYGVKKMPDEVNNHQNGSDTMNDTSDMKASLCIKYRFQELNFIKKNREAGYDKDQKSNDKHDVLDTFAKIHPDGNFIIRDKKIFF